MSRSPFDKKTPQLSDFGDLFLPEEAAEPILAGPVRRAMLEWLEEMWAADELKAAGLKPRQRAIFDGPPGVGKTTLAHHMAARLGLPMLAVRPDRIIDCWVGSTGRNLGDLFETVRAQAAAGNPVVLFMDEFDALAAKRRSAAQAADVSRNDMVNTLLQRLEQHDGIVITATNFGSDIDPAIWRRLEVHINLELPGQFERVHILARYMAPYGLPADDLERLARSTDMASPALLRSLCEAIKRQMILGPRLNQPMDRTSVLERVLTSCLPHPEAQSPQLWSLGVKDVAVTGMTWPWPLASEVIETRPAAPVEAAPKVISLADRR